LWNVESIRKSSIQLILTRHEQAAAFMAATYGRLTGRPGVCLTTLGPGALNLATGAAYALLGAMPMIVITGQKGILASRQARFQIVDIVATMKPLTKLSRQIISPSMIPTLVREAFRVAEEERPGPVHLELPEDIAAEECEQVPVVPPHPVELPLASADSLGRAAQMIMQAQCPLLMLGAAASRPWSTSDLARFVLRTRIPYFTTQMGKGTVPGGTELYLGTAALSERDYVHEAIERADLIITIGHDTVEKPPFIMGTKGPMVIHIGYQPANVEQVYFPQAEVIGDLGPSLKLLADRIEGKIPNAGGICISTTPVVGYTHDVVSAPCGRIGIRGPGKALGTRRCFGSGVARASRGTGGPGLYNYCEGDRPATRQGTHSTPTTR
jgi:acetolactate synthase-1/2/3 large subunit